jgi:asparagine synthase (glutamine-hydrolysing)
MCGIFGVVGSDSQNGLRDAAKTLSHRGPDGFGEWWSEQSGVYLAHCRLAIIDLSEAGRQPMANEDGSIQLTFNGEIYNFQSLRMELIAAGYRFRSRSDTEVVVRGYEHWGDAVVEKLRGIFAFGLWDSKRRRMLMARDALGTKPLYYTLNGKRLAFASEPRALLPSIPGGPKLEVSGALQFLRHSYISGTHSIWQGVSRLPPATTLAFDAENGGFSTRRFWCYRDVDSSWTYSQAVDAADTLLEEAVREELVSDVPVGVLLSGGVDSSLVSAYAAKASPHIKSFCVDFVGWAGSEREDAAIAARHLGTTHLECAVDKGSSNLADPDHAREFFRAWDEPIGDTAIIPTWHLSRLIRQHVTVALSGDGGDEIFGGYRWYAQVARNWRGRAGWAAERVRRMLGQGREWPNGCADANEYYHLLHCPSFSGSELSLLFPQWQREIAQLSAGMDHVETCAPLGKGQRRWQQIDVHSYLVDNNLARVDRASMAHGLEVRVPLLDQRVTELGLSLPEELRSASGLGKPVLRALTRRLLPERIQTKPKQGFSFPLNRFVSDAEMLARIRSGSLIRNDVLSSNGLNTWLARSGNSNLTLKLWLLFVLENWSSEWLFASRQMGPA